MFPFIISSIESTCHLQTLYAEIHSNFHTVLKTRAGHKVINTSGGSGQTAFHVPNIHSGQADMPIVIRSLGTDGLI